MEENEFKVGDKVSYITEHSEPEHGIVKSIPDDAAFLFVVYSCAEEWNKYNKYTAARTPLSSLKKGWL